MERSSMQRGAVVSIAGLLGVLAFASATLPAGAVELPEPIFTDVHVVEDSVPNGGNVTVEFKFEAPAGVAGGDTTTVSLPPGLRFASSGSVQVKTPEGEVIATLSSSGDNTSVMVSFAGAVNGAGRVIGSGHFTASVLVADADRTVRSYVFDNAGRPFNDSLAVIPGVLTDQNFVFVDGIWTRDDKGGTDPVNAIEWRAEAAIGAWESQEITLTPADESGKSTSLLDCSTLEFAQYTVPADWPLATHPDRKYYESNRMSWDGLGAQVVECGPEIVTVKFANPAAARQYLNFTIRAAVVDTETTKNFWATTSSQGVRNGLATNSSWRNFIARDSALGEGSVHRPAIAVDKFSASDGVVEGDYDVAPGKSVLAGRPEQISLVIRNIGNETLTDISLEDRVVTGPALRDLECALEEVVLLPGKSVTCTGQLDVTAENASYHDIATVSAIGKVSEAKVSAEDAWNATLTTSPAPAGRATPTPIPSSVPPFDPAPMNRKQTPGDLASTGASLEVVGGLALLILATGTLLFVVARRRRVGR